MPSLPRLRHDPEDPKHLLHCGNDDCWNKRAPLLLGKMPVGLELTSSAFFMIVMPDGTYHEFKKGAVESLTCSNCEAKFYPISAYDPA